MKRYLDPEQYGRFLADFGFLFDKIRKSAAELDLKLRDNYFNIYYRGNSLAKIEFNKDDSYRITINEKFVKNKNKNNREYFIIPPELFPSRKDKNGYLIYSVATKKLRAFLQKKYIDGLCANISLEDYGEEIAFEQILITDNVNREDLLIIDRQVTEPGFKKKMDLLALKQILGEKYRFVIIEVKLGKNDELSEKVAGQLDNYVDRLKSKFSEWKISYETSYSQMKKTKIFDKPSHDKIEILDGVEGLVIVGLYSQVAREKIKILHKNHPEICVKLLTNKIDLT